MAYGVLLGQRPKTGLGAKVYLTAYQDQDTSSLTNVTATGQNTGKSYTATYNATAQAFIFSIDVYDTYTFSGVLDGNTLTQTAAVNASKKIDVVLGPVLSSTLNDNSWAAIRYAADNDLGESIWAVGDAKQITLNGTVGILELSNYQPYVYILGFNHNAEKEGQNMIHFGFGKTAASGGTDIALVDSKYLTTESSAAFRINITDTSAGGWSASYMRNNICGTSKQNLSATIMGAISVDLRNVLKSVTKYTNNVGVSSASNAVTATTDYFFLLSEYEVFGTITYSNSYEANYQQQYAYYSTGNSKIKYLYNNTGSDATYWTRSPYTDNQSFLLVNPGGINLANPRRSLGFAPAFCV